MTASIYRIPALPRRPGHCGTWPRATCATVKRGHPPSPAPRHHGFNRVGGVFSWLSSDSAPCPSQRPYDIHSATPVDEILSVFKVARVHYSSTWCEGMVTLLKKVRGRPRACLAREPKSLVPERASQRTTEREDGAAVWKERSQRGSKSRVGSKSREGSNTGSRGL